MKKIFLLSVVCMCVLGCGEPKTGPYVVKNTTNDQVTILVSADTYETSTYILQRGDEQDTGINYYTPTVKPIQDTLNKSIIDNRYNAQRSGFNVSIVKAPENVYTVQNQIPDAVYNAGSEKLYLIEKNNKMGQYYNPATPVKQELSAGVDDLQCTVYTDWPSFTLINSEGVENMLNGSAVSIVSVIDSVILIK